MYDYKVRFPCREIREAQQLIPLPQYPPVHNPRDCNIFFADTALLKQSKGE